MGYTNFVPAKKKLNLEEVKKAAQKKTFKTKLPNKKSVRFNDNVEINEFQKDSVPKETENIQSEQTPVLNVKEEKEQFEMPASFGKSGSTQN